MRIRAVLSIIFMASCYALVAYSMYATRNTCQGLGLCP